MSVSEDIVQGIDDGKIALPEFQRDFDWNQARIVSLLTSVARRWPIGTLLTISGEKVADLGWGRRALEGAPRLRTPNVLVLDGQQRLTSLYHAIRDVSEDVYFCHIGRVIDRNEVDDDDIESLKKTEFQKRYPDVSAENAAGIIKISRLFFDEAFGDWLRYTDPAQHGALYRVREGPLAGLRSGSYSIPAIQLEGEVPLGVVAKIFESTNRGAMILDAFDLMVARLYPREFNLREKWRDAQDRYGFPDRMALEALQVIALREHIRGANDVRGIRQSDVLELDADVVIRDWDQSVAALHRAIRFMADYCGAVRLNLIPSAAMRIPLADALWDGAASNQQRDRLRRWYWWSTVDQTYAQGANTQAVSDARALRAWETSGQAPESIKAAVPESLAESLMDTRRRNQMLTRGVLCILINRDARDWMENQRFDDSGSTAIDVHHVFPADYVEKSWSEKGNVVANFTPLFASTNRSLRSDHPKAVLGNNDVHHDNIWTHRIPRKEFSDENWPAFIERRVEMLIEAFGEELRR